MVFAGNTGTRGRVEPGVLPQDRRVQLLERRAWLDPELADEGPTRVVVRLERIGLPTRAVEREHQLAA